MTSRACVHLPLDETEIYAIIYIQIIITPPTPHDLLVRVDNLDNERNPDIFSKKIERGYIFRMIHQKIQSKIPELYK